MAEKKKFLFLQGPHGRFLYQLSRSLKDAGCNVLKIGFNAGDQFFWRDASSFLPFSQDYCFWPDFVEQELERGVTDLVVYGDTRPVHATAIELAKSKGIRVHCFEEGYIRPYWVTYERNGVNGHSRLMQMTVPQMQEALKNTDPEQPEAPAHWGEMRQHMFLGALYHWQVLFRNQKYSKFVPHRDTSVAHEFRLHLRRLLSQPLTAFRRRVSTFRLVRRSTVYHLVLLQLGHDASIRSHSEFDDMTRFMTVCSEAFAKGAPLHHHLVFKAHPLEDNRENLEKVSRDLARKFGFKGRAHFVNGGKLASLLDYAKSVVTINSTAAQQALWRGLPVRAIGKSVYSKPEFTSGQSLVQFFKNPRKPDMKAYRAYRQFLLATSQITGGFYSRKSRARLIRTVVDMMLSDQDPYEALSKPTEAPMQHLRSMK